MIFITSEYLPKTLSTINRCLIAEMPDIDINKLTYLQDEQGLYVEFIIDFIGWVCKNFQKLNSWISDEKNIALLQSLIKILIQMSIAVLIGSHVQHGY